MKKIALYTVTLFVAACHPTPGPDKTVAGSILGAGWGAGAGAIIGNQVNDMSQGAAIGAGFGFASGLVTGIQLDAAEVTEIEQQQEIDALRLQVASNQRSLLTIQSELDDRSRKLSVAAQGSKVFFDPDTAEIRPGVSKELVRLASSLKSNPYLGRVEVHGYTDDMGDGELNQKMSETRAKSVATFLINQGVSMDKVKVVAHGATNPAATNSTDIGRQLNRRVEITVKK